MSLKTKIRVNKANGQLSIAIPKALVRLLGWEHGDTVLITLHDTKSIRVEKVEE